MTCYGIGIANRVLWDMGQAWYSHRTRMDGYGLNESVVRDEAGDTFKGKILILASNMKAIDKGGG